MVTQRHERCFCVSIVFIHVVLVAWCSFRNSPTSSESAHLPAGLYYWEHGRFDLFNANPPLVRLIAAAPVVFCHPATDWSKHVTGPTARPEFHIARRFISENGGTSVWYYRLARWACLPLTLIGCYTCWRWSRELYGVRAGILSLAVWCFSPNVIAWAATITTDLAAAVTGILASYCFWRWLRNPRWRNAITAGTALGICLLTKSTWIVLLVLWPGICLVSLRRPSRTDVAIVWRPLAMQLAVMLLTAIYVVNVGYGFEGSFRPLGDYEFISRTLAGADAHVNSGFGGNRFAGTRLGGLLVPLPSNYLLGMDVVKYDFEKRMWSYLNGEWKFGGWWYYYLVAAAYKVPLGTWLLSLIALAGSLRRISDLKVRRLDELILLAPATAVFLLVSSQTGFSHHLRYVLPCFPFIAIWIGSILRKPVDTRFVPVLVAVALAWSLMSSLWIYPHSLAYFNELTSGPRGGARYLDDDNIDSGQDLLYLNDWFESHPDARPFFNHASVNVNPGKLGLEMPVSPEVQHGWNAINVRKLYARTGRYRQILENQKPVAIVGHTIYIFYIPEPGGESA